MFTTLFVCGLLVFGRVPWLVIIPDFRAHLRAEKDHINTYRKRHGLR